MLQFSFIRSGEMEIKKYWDSFCIGNSLSIYFALHFKLLFRGTDVAKSSILLGI